MRAGIHHFMPLNGGGEVPVIIMKIFLSFLWGPTSLLLQLLPVGNGHNIRRASSLL